MGRSWRGRPRVCWPHEKPSRHDRSHLDRTGTAILDAQTCPIRAGSRDAPLVMGEEASEVARDAAGGPEEQGDRLAGGAAPDRTDSCTSRSSARRAANAAAPAMERSSRTTARPQPSVLDPDRPLAPSEGSNHGSRDRGGAAPSDARGRTPPDLPAPDVSVGRAGHPSARARPGRAEGARQAARGRATRRPSAQPVSEEQGSGGGHREGARTATAGSGEDGRRRSARGGGTGPTRPQATAPAQPRRPRPRRTRPGRFHRDRAGRERGRTSPSRPKVARTTVPRTGARRQGTRGGRSRSGAAVKEPEQTPGSQRDDAQPDDRTAASTDASADASATRRRWVGDAKEETTPRWTRPEAVWRG